MANLKEILGDSFNSLPEDIKSKYKNIDLVDSSNYIEKSKFDEVSQSKKQLEKDIKDRNKQLEDLKKSTGDNEELKKQIEQLQSDNKKKDEDHQAELKDLKLTNAIKLAISGKAQGLDEQVKSLEENKAFLFKSEEKNNNNNPLPGFRVGNDGNQKHNDPGISMRDAIASHIQSQIQK